MYGLFPCIPIFRGVFLLKSVKKCVYILRVKITLTLVKSVCFGVKKGYEQIIVLGRCKTHYSDIKSYISIFTGLRPLNLGGC